MKVVFTKYSEGFTIMTLPRPREESIASTMSWKVF